MRCHVAAHMDIGLRVDRIADFAKLGQHCAWVLPDEKRTVVSAGNARDQRIEIGRNPDRMATVSLINRRVSSFRKAPPPVAMTFGGPSSKRLITRRSPSRKYSSPNRSNISGMLIPAADWISSSESTKSTPSCEANDRPTVDFPAPIMPTSTSERSSFRLLS